MLSQSYHGHVFVPKSVLTILPLFLQHFEIMCVTCLSLLFSEVMGKSVRQSQISCTPATNDGVQLIRRGCMIVPAADNDVWWEISSIGCLF